MKSFRRIIASFVSVLMVLSCCASFAQEIDLSGMHYEELVSLKEKIDLAIRNHEQWGEVEVPPGSYQVGVDIPTGYWTVRCADDYSFTFVAWGAELNESGDGIVASSVNFDGYFLDSPNGMFATSCSFVAIEGYYILIDNAPAVFTPYSGPSDFTYYRSKANSRFNWPQKQSDNIMDVLGENIDLSSMGYDELVLLKRKVNLAIWNSSAWWGVEVPTGSYQVGVDIPSGNWTVLCADDSSYTRISLGVRLSKDKDQIFPRQLRSDNKVYNQNYEDYDPDKHSTEYSFEAIDEYYVVISSGSAIFTQGQNSQDVSTDSIDETASQFQMQFFMDDESESAYNSSDSQYTYFSWVGDNGVLINKSEEEDGQEPFKNRAILATPGLIYYTDEDPFVYLLLYILDNKVLTCDSIIITAGDTRYNFNNLKYCNSYLSTANGYINEIYVPIGPEGIEMLKAIDNMYQSNNGMELRCLFSTSTENIVATLSADNFLKDNADFLDRWESANGDTVPLLPSLDTIFDLKVF